MQVVDAEWIRSRLTGRRGEKAALARAMHISPNKVSLILKGDRRVQPEEIPGALSFFGEGGAGHGQHDGFAESEVAPYRPELREDDREVSFDPQALSNTLYTARTNLLAFGILAGDTLAVDLKAEPANGDLVLVTQAHEDGSATTFIARLAGDHAVPSDPLEAPIPIGDDGQAAINGTIRGVLRDLNR